MKIYAPVLSGGAVAGPRQGAAAAGRWRSITVRSGSSPALPVYAHRPADDLRGRRGAATDARAVDGLDGVRRRWTHCRQDAKQEARSLLLLVLVLVFVVLVWLVVHVVRPPGDASRKGNKGVCSPKSVFSKA